MDAIQNLFVDLTKQQMKLFKLNAVYFPKPIAMPDRKTNKLQRGDVIRIEDGVIVDCYKWEKATHVITEMKGRIGYEEYYIEVADLDTNETFTLKIQ